MSYRGKTLLSVIDPIAGAERLADAAPKQERTLYFCPSPLYGYGLERLLSRIPEDSAVIAVETDEALLALSRESLPRPLFDHPRFRVVGTADPASLCAFVRGAWGSRCFRRLIVVRLSGGWQIGGPCYEALADALREDIARDWENALTLTRLGRRYMINAIRNLPLLVRKAGTAKSLCFGETPVLVLGAGPSLDDLLDVFAAKSGRAGYLFRPGKRPFKIVCVDTALKNLYARGIKPDLALLWKANPGICGILPGWVSGNYPWQWTFPPCPPPEKLWAAMSGFSLPPGRRYVSLSALTRRVSFRLNCRPWVRWASPPWPWP